MAHGRLVDIPGKDDPKHRTKTYFLKDRALKRSSNKNGLFHKNCLLTICVGQSIMIPTRMKHIRVDCDLDERRRRTRDQTSSAKRRYALRHKQTAIHPRAHSRKREFIRHHAPYVGSHPHLLLYPDVWLGSCFPKLHPGEAVRGV